MFAKQTGDKKKTSVETKNHRAQSAAKKVEAEPSPIWQSLALRPLSLQRKLAISQPNDPYEQEADRVAERVMRMPAPSCCGEKSLAPARRAAQRKCATCEDEEEIKLQ